MSPDPTKALRTLLAITKSELELVILAVPSAKSWPVSKQLSFRGSEAGSRVRRPAARSARLWRFLRDFRDNRRVARPTLELEMAPSGRHPSQKWHATPV